MKMTIGTAPHEIVIAKIGQIAVNVHDTTRAVEFYRDVLGLTLLFTAGHLAFFDCGGVRLMLSPPEKPEFDHPSSVLYFKVNDIQGAHALLVAKAAKIEAEPRLVAKLPDHDLWLSFFRDSENNLMALMAEVKHEPAQ
jgi:methylmalonyl-CoA/ethylmalonyl-CoA epimerase